MRSGLAQPSRWQRLRPYFSAYDLPLLATVLLLAAGGLVTSRMFR